MGSRKKKQKREQKKRRPGRQGPVQVGLPPNAIVLHSPPGEVKMSEVILDFIEPYSDHWSTREDLVKLLSVAMVAWNASLLSGAERDEFIADMEKAVPPEAREPMREIVKEMIQRKLSRFASNRRAIMDCQVSMTPEGPHVTVMSTLEKT